MTAGFAIAMRTRAGGMVSTATPRATLRVVLRRAGHLRSPSFIVQVVA